MADQYLEFMSYPKIGKTEIYGVLSKNQRAELGRVKWFGRWRQYAFFPNTETAWNPECLDSISGFIRNLMDERRLAQKEKKP